MLILNHVLKLPTPRKITYFWKFGSILGAVLVFQVIRGVFLCLSYVAFAEISFSVIDSLVREIKGGDIVRNIHANGASLFFLFLYLHTGRGIYFKSFKNKLHVWMIGLTILILRMAIAFLGYVLPWGQMSYWGATVITKLFRVVPLIGSNLVKWVWGGFSVSSVTLTRFFGLHVILPLVLCAIVGLHIILLHSTGSRNPLGVQLNYNTFHPYWTKKDVFGIAVVAVIWCYLVFLNPFFFMDSENFIEANFLVTPIHIQPEWYFLPAYAVLRSVPKKLGGVIGLLMVYAIFYIKPFLYNWKIIRFNLNKFLFWNWIMVVMCLLWIGMCPVEGLYIIVGQIFTFLYFLMVLFI